MLSISFCLFGKQPTSDEALQRLIEGNNRFAKGMKEGANRTPERRLETEESQAPFAVIVSCSDSRVAPELLFDAGIGELFVVRTAGNVVEKVGMESVNYGVEALEAPLVVVLGHQHCGAVDAVLSGKDSIITQIAKLIRPAVKKAKKETSSDKLIIATKANAENTAKQLSAIPTIKQKIAKKKVVVRAAYYDMSTGKVEFIAKKD